MGINEQLLEMAGVDVNISLRIGVKLRSGGGGEGGVPTLAMHVYVRGLEEIKIEFK